MKNIYLRLTQPGQVLTKPVLATVTGTTGSTPQKPGSLALFSDGNLLAGTVGGGIVENRVQAFANQCSRNGESIYVSFSLDNGIERKDEAICGGTISVLLDADPLFSLPLFRQIEQDLAAGIPGVLVTVVTILKVPHVNIRRHWITAASAPVLPDYLTDQAKKEVSALLSSPGSAKFHQPEAPAQDKAKSTLVFLEPLFPLPRLVIAGAGHIGKALSHLGKMLDFEVTVADSRSEYANALNLPDADHTLAGDIGKIMEDIKKDSDTYIVIMTHGHAGDAEVLRSCIRSGAGYIGMIGSRSKIAKMREEFISKKWATNEEWQRIYSPVGIDIGSKTVEEIAVSIAAQLVIVRSRKSDPQAGGLKT